MTYQHILVATDLNDECHPVVARAQALATAHNAKLALVHVIEPMAMAFGGDVPMDLSMLQQQQFDQARERIAIFADRYPGLTPEQQHLAYGQPRQEIHRLARAGTVAGLHRQRHPSRRLLRCARSAPEERRLIRRPLHLLRHSSPMA